MCKPESIASTCCATVQTYVQWHRNGCLAEACTQNKFASCAQPSVTLAQMSALSSRMRIAKLVLTNAENVLTNAEEWPNEDQGGAPSPYFMCNFKIL